MLVRVRKTPNLGHRVNLFLIKGTAETLEYSEKWRIYWRNWKEKNKLKVKTNFEGKYMFVWVCRLPIFDIAFISFQLRSSKRRNISKNGEYIGKRGMKKICTKIKTNIFKVYSDKNAQKVKSELTTTTKSNFNNTFFAILKASIWNSNWFYIREKFPFHSNFSYKTFFYEAFSFCLVLSFFYLFLIAIIYYNNCIHIYFPSLCSFLCAVFFFLIKAFWLHFKLY